MTPSDIAAYSSLIERGSIVTLLVTVVIALALLTRWLFNLVLRREAKEREYREAEITKRDVHIEKLLAQADRSQDLFDQALNMLEREGRAGVRT